MKYFVGALLIAIGFFHGLHAFGIDAGSVGNLNGSRFLSFATAVRLNHMRRAEDQALARLAGRFCLVPT